LRQRALLAGEALATGRRQPGVAEDLDRRHRAEVVTLGVIDDAHAAFAEHARETVRSKMLSGDAVLARAAEDRVGGRADTSVEQRIVARVPGEERDRVADERRIVPALALEVRALFRRWKVYGGVEERLHSRPARGVHVSASAEDWSCAARERATPWRRASRG